MAGLMQPLGYVLGIKHTVIFSTQGIEGIKILKAACCASRFYRPSLKMRHPCDSGAVTACQPYTGLKLILHHNLRQSRSSLNKASSTAYEDKETTVCDIVCTAILMLHFGSPSHALHDKNLVSSIKKKPQLITSSYINLLKRAFCSPPISFWYLQ